MTPEQVRIALQNWLSARVSISAWTTNLPPSIANSNRPIGVAVSDAAELIEFQGGEIDPQCPVVTVTFPIEIVFRFSKDLKYGELPISEAERVLISLIHQLSERSHTVDSDIKSISCTGRVVAAKPGQQNQFWAILMQLSPKVQFRIESTELKIGESVFSRA